MAGEHTAPFVALGTVTGAYWSGEGVARRIVVGGAGAAAGTGRADGGEEKGEGVREREKGGSVPTKE